MVSVEAILERFERGTVVRFTPEAQTRRTYPACFKRFAKDVGLETYSRRQLAGPKGRELLLAHLAKIPVRSRRVVHSALKCVWMEGLGLPWPIDLKRDFGKTLPQTRRRESPPEKDILAWARALQNETDPYVKVLVGALLEYGWRPENQLGRLRRKHIVYENGEPYAIVADGVEAGFKSAAPIIAWITPDFRDALKRWFETCHGSPEDPILPWRGLRGEIAPTRRLQAKAVRAELRAFAKKWGIPYLAPVYFRHAVKTMLRKAGMSDPAMSAWQGHKATEGGMRAVYDNPSKEALLDEQASTVPRGPLSVLKPPEVKIVNGPETEALALLRAYLDGELGLMDLMSKIEGIKRSWTSRVQSDKVL